MSEQEQGLDAEAFYKDVCRVLIELAGARETVYELFYYVQKDCTEYRFQGRFGFGGKYYVYDNQVGYYPEDITPDREALRDRVNAELAALAAKHNWNPWWAKLASAK